MSLRKSTVQISVEIEAQEGVKRFRELTQQSTRLKKEIKALEKSGKENTKEYKLLQTQLGKVNDEFAELGGQGATMGQLISRSRKLKREMMGLAEGTKRFAQVEKELQQVNTRLGTMRQRTRGVKKGMEGMKAQSLAAIGAIGLALNRAINFGSEALDLYDQQAKAEAALLLALDDNAAAFERLTARASEFQEASLFGDEVLIAQQAYLANLGLTEKGIDQTLKAAMDLSAGLGISLESAVKNLAKTFGGLTGELGESIPQLKNFTKEELIAGKAIEFVTQQFEGQAEAAAKAGTGIKTQLDNAIGDLMETLGQMISGPFLKFVNLVKGVIAPTKQASEATAELQTQFNVEIETLKKNNISTENRKKLIEQMNLRYKEFLPKQISLNASLSELEGIQKKVNEAFQQRIILLAAEEQLIKVQKELLATKQEELELELEINKARLKNEKLGTGAALLGSDTTFRQSALDANKKRQEELRAEFQKTIDAAQELGLNIDKILGGATGSSSSGSGNVAPSGTSSTTNTTSNVTETISKEINVTDPLIDNNQFIKEDISDDDLRTRLENQYLIEEEFLKQKFFEQLLTEQEFQDQLFEVQRLAAERKIRMLTAKHGEESLQAQQAKTELLELETEHEESKRALVEQTEEFKKQVRGASFEQFSQTIEAGISLLGQDAEARKKNAKLIQKIEAAKTIVFGIKEIQGIFSSFSSLGPVGQILAVVQAAIAGVRTARAVKKITGVGFYEGGFTGNRGLFNDKQGRPVVGGVHANEWVAPEWMTTSPEYAPVIQGLENARTRGYNEGGFASDSTTPPAGISAPTPTSNDNLEALLRVEQSIKESNNQVVAAIRTKQFAVMSGQIVDAIEDEQQLEADGTF